MKSSSRASLKSRTAQRRFWRPGTRRADSTKKMVMAVWTRLRPQMMSDFGFLKQLSKLYGRARRFEREYQKKSAKKMSDALGFYDTAVTHYPILPLSGSMQSGE